MDIFFEMSPDLLVVADTEGYFIRVNPAWLRETGYRKEDLLTHKFIEFVHPDDVQKTLDTFKTIRTQDSHRFRNRYRRADGTYITLSWTSTKFTEDGVTYAIARVISDLNS